MKDTDSKCVYKYLGLLFTDVFFIFFTFIVFTSHYNNYYSWLFSYANIFVVLATPIYLVLRGVISRVILKRALLPNILLFVEIWLLFFLEAFFESDHIFTLSRLIISLIITLLSFIPSLITAGVIWIIKSGKGQNNNK